VKGFAFAEDGVKNDSPKVMPEEDAPAFSAGAHCLPRVANLEKGAERAAKTPGIAFTLVLDSLYHCHQSILTNTTFSLRRRALAPRYLFQLQLTLSYLLPHRTRSY
jgi:hypothetical protein